MPVAALEGSRVSRHGQLTALDPLLIPDQIDHDAAVRRASPDLALVSVAALDLSFHGFHGIAHEQARQRQQHVPRRRQYRGALSVGVDHDFIVSGGL
jgi:hypothetical protein